MTYDVIVLPEAYDDLREMIAWVHERSPDGAARLTASFESQLQTLKTHPQSHPWAPERQIVGRPIRQMFFQTKKGKRRRALFEIRGNQVFVLHVRGSGQDLLDEGTVRDV